jgi:hypothetical protein
MRLISLLPAITVYTVSTMAPFSTSAAVAFQNSEATIRKVLTTSRNIALVGASSKSERPSNYVMKFLLDKGYNVFPVNPGIEGQELHGQLVYGRLADIPEQIDMVDIFRESSAVPAIVDEAIAIGGVQSIWMQQGIVNMDAAEKAKRAALDVVMGKFERCCSRDELVVEAFLTNAITSLSQMLAQKCIFLFLVLPALVLLVNCNKLT